jgi:hypothetical protein
MFFLHNYQTSYTMLLSYCKSLLIFIASVFFFTSCHDLLDEEIAPADEQISSNLVAREMMTTETVDGARISATCETIKPGSSSDELYLICIPENWNGELLLYAHGYVSAYEDELTFAEAEELAPVATSLGFAFATTTYSSNGLHILQGIGEMIQLKDYFEANYDTPSYTYLTGGSQGGAVTTLALENNPDVFDGGFSLCGPCGNFEKQLNHYGDFRLLFDYFFGNIVSLPGNVGEIPQDLILNWDSYWVPEITAAITSHPRLTQKLLSVSKAPVDPNDPSTVVSTVINTLWYNIFTVEDAKLKIAGKIYDNTNRWYYGTGSLWQDFLLNRKIPRVTIEASGIYPLNQYETTGYISDPLVMMHTTLDPIQLIWNQTLYRLKVLAAGRSIYFAAYPIPRYGHCEFTDIEIVLGLYRLILKVKGQELLLAKQLLDLHPPDDILVRSVSRVSF